MLTSLAPALMATCERGTSTALWSEPVNLLSALAFLVVAMAAVRLWLSSGRQDRGTLGLIAATAAIGLCWPLAHLGWPAPTPLAEGAPVLVFGMAAFTLILRRALAFTPLQVAGACLALLLAMGLMAHLSGALAAIVVPLVVLYCLAATLILRGRLGMHHDRDLKGSAAARSDRLHFPQVKLGYALIQTGILLALGVVARAGDAAFCGVLPAGLHALWHLLAALAAATLVFGVLRHAPGPSAAGFAGAEACAPL